MTNLIDVLHYFGSSLDRGGQIGMVYMDMSKAFDKVHHRKQCVTVLGAKTNSLSITSGVPQGSKEMRTTNHAKQLQDDINNLETWSTTSGLSFNETKCKAQTITRKLKPITSKHTLKHCQLTSTQKRG